MDAVKEKLSHDRWIILCKFNIPKLISDIHLNISQQIFNEITEAMNIIIRIYVDVINFNA